MTRYFSEVLGRRDRTSFDCGHERVNAYFRTGVSQDIRRNYASCYVLIERNSGILAGFYSLSATDIPLPDIPPELARKLPRYPSVPTVLIGWLGRDDRFRGKAVGGLLLQDAIARTARSGIGAHAICADAIDAAALRFYQRFQFTAFSSRPRSLFLTLATALKAIEE